MSVKQVMKTSQHQNDDKKPSVRFLTTGVSSTPKNRSRHQNNKNNHHKSFSSRLQHNKANMLLLRHAPRLFFSPNVRQSYRWATENGSHGVSPAPPDSGAPCALTGHGIVELVLAEGAAPRRPLRHRQLQLVVLGGQRLQRRGEDLVLLHLVLQFQTAHLRSPHTHTHLLLRLCSTFKQKPSV